MKQRRWIVVAVIVLAFLLLGGAFILVNFSAMTSHLENNSSLASSGGSAEAGPQNNASTAIYVSGDARLRQALQAELARLLKGRAEYGEIRVLKALTDRTDLPYLFVEIQPQELLWTPIYAKAGLKVSLAYASDGDVSFRLTQPVQFFHEGDRPAVKRSGSYTFSDESWGLISSPGYTDYLARTIAGAIAKSLERQ